MTQSEDEKKALIRTAIRELKQIVGYCNGLPREFCPHILGTKRGEWAALVWQFGGQSSRGGIPSWRKFELRDLEQLTLRDGEWHRGWEKGRRQQTAVDMIDTVVDLDHAAEIRETSPTRTPAPFVRRLGQKKWR